MAGSLRKLFTDKEVREAYGDAGGYADAAKKLTELGRGEVSRAIMRYWMKQFDSTKKNGDYYRTNTKTNRAIREDMKLRSPSPTDDLSKIPHGTDTERICFFTDMHAPYHHPDTIEFLDWIKQEFDPTMWVCGGDESDQHALSFHDSDPNLDSAGPELLKTQEFISELEDLVPDLVLVHSNHGSLVYRRAKKFGIPVQCIKSYREILFPNGGGEGWSWIDQHRIKLPNGQDLQFEHQASGDLLAMAAHERCNIAIGHLHGKFAVNYAASKAALYWALNGGCLLDKDSMAFAYGRHFKLKPIIGASMILNSVPTVIPMMLDSDGRWEGRSKLS